MKTLLLFTTALLAGVLGAQPVVGQRPGIPQKFSASTVVLTNGDTLRGSLTLLMDMDLLLITMADNTVRTVPALLVRTFAVRNEIISFDQIPLQAYSMGNMRTRARRWGMYVQRSRPFLVYPWNHGRNYAATAAPAFFERLNGGPVILLRRQQMVQRSMPYANLGYGYGYQPAYNRYYSYTDVREQLYLGTPEGSVVTLHKPKRDLLAYFPAEAEMIEEYARMHDLSFTDSSHLARLVDYANDLRRQVQ